MASRISHPPAANWQRDSGGLILELSGDWRRDGPNVNITDAAKNIVPTSYQVAKLGSYDSTLPAFILSLIRSATEYASAKDKPVPSLNGLPESLQGLLTLALTEPVDIAEQTELQHPSRTLKLGNFTLQVWMSIHSLLDFTGQTVYALGRLFTGKAQFRTTDLWIVIQQCGVQALPIVSLISFLIGLILAFVGNVQLSNFGANLFVADLVGIAMVREMGVVMTAIIMSGRTGAAFAAFIGTMKVNEEIDALQTFGFSPFDYLVLPRFLALVLMMPILTIYANVVGILGGMLVGLFVGIDPILYWTETLAAVDLTNSSLGVIKSVFFGAIIATCSCMEGLNAGASSEAVGLATTRAVVASITMVIVLDSAFAAIFTLLNI